MSTIDPSADFNRVIDGASTRVRAIIEVVSDHLRSHQHDEAISHARSALINTQPDHPDLPPMIALTVASRACAVLGRNANDPSELLWAPAAALQPETVQAHRATVEAAVQWLEARIREANEDAWPCPNCGRKRSRTIGIAPLAPVDRSCAGTLFDLSRLAADARSDPPLNYRTWNLIASELARQKQWQCAVDVCDSCSLMHLNWPIDPERVKRFYVDPPSQAQLVNGQQVVGAAENFLFALEKARFVAFVARRFSPLDGKRVLDFGCAEGIVLAGLQEFGAKTVGFDLDVKRLRYAQNVLGLSDLASEEDRLATLPDGIIDFAISFHTLNRIPDVDRALARISSLLVPGGSFVFVVPHLRVGPNHTIQGLDGGSLVGFDHATMPIFLERHGLTVDLLAVAGEGLPAVLQNTDGTALWSGRNDDMLVVAKKL